MVIVIGPNEAYVADAENFRAFAVRLTGPQRKGEIDFHGCGTIAPDGKHVSVMPSWIEENVGSLAEEPTWSDGFAAMIRYAASKGWIDEAGRIRGHIVGKVE